LKGNRVLRDSLGEFGCIYRCAEQLLSLSR
jgi:hypothetical protein